MLRNGCTLSARVAILGARSSHYRETGTCAIIRDCTSWGVAKCENCRVAVRKAGNPDEVHPHRVEARLRAIAGRSTSGKAHRISDSNAIN